MKTIKIFLVLWLLSGWLVSADFQKIFNRANQLYENGKFEEALSHYLQVKKSMSHWRLFYNMGNCYFKLGEYVRAKIYYLRAKKIKPFLPSLERNINIVNKNFKDKFKAEKSDFIRRTIARMESVIPVNVVSIMLVIFVLFFNVFIFFIFRKGRKKWIIYGLSIFLLLTLIASFYHIYRVNKQSQDNTAVIINENSQLRSGPGENNTILFKVNPGLEVKIIDKSRNWFQVSASSEIAGWVKAADLEII